jgi:hypothetical protein
LSDAKIHKSTANMMKNKVYAMGGNLVYIQQQFNKNEKLTNTLTNQTMLGYVYQCQGLELMQQNLGESVEILWEGQKEEIDASQHKVFGYTPNYLRVATIINDSESLENQIIEILQSGSIAYG